MCRLLPPARVAERADVSEGAHARSGGHGWRGHGRPGSGSWAWRRPPLSGLPWGSCHDAWDVSAPTMLARVGSAGGGTVGPAPGRGPGVGPPPSGLPWGSCHDALDVLEGARAPLRSPAGRGPVSRATGSSVGSRPTDQLDGPASSSGARPPGDPASPSAHEARASWRAPDRRCGRPVVGGTAGPSSTLVGEPPARPDSAVRFDELPASGWTARLTSAGRGATRWRTALARADATKLRRVCCSEAISPSAMCSPSVDGSRSPGSGRRPPVAGDETAGDPHTHAPIRRGVRAGSRRRNPGGPLLSAGLGHPAPRVRAPLGRSQSGSGHVGRRDRLHPAPRAIADHLVTSSRRAGPTLPRLVPSGHV